MYKQLVQDIIAVTNKAIDNTSVKYTIETKDTSYNAYNGVYYDDNHVEFTDDDYDNEINLSYEDIIGIRVGDV